MSSTQLLCLPGLAETESESGKQSRLEAGAASQVLKTMIMMMIILMIMVMMMIILMIMGMMIFMAMLLFRKYLSLYTKAACCIKLSYIALHSHHSCVGAPTARKVKNW